MNTEREKIQRVCVCESERKRARECVCERERVRDQKERVREKGRG